MKESIDAGLVLEYKDGDFPHNCRPCFLVGKPGSTAKQLVVDYGEVNRKTLNHSGSIPNMESTLDSLLPPQDQDGQADFILASGPDAQCSGAPSLHHPSGRVFQWKVMPFGVASAPVSFQGLMNKILSIGRQRVAR